MRFGILESLRDSDRASLIRSFSLFLRICNDLSVAISLHRDIAANGCCEDPDLGALLVQLFGKVGSVDRARSVFEALPRKNALCWNFAIGALTHNGRDEEALDLFRRMALEGGRPDRHTFVRVLGACKNAAMAAQGKEIHEQISWSGLDADLMLQNSLVAMYGRCGRLDLAKSVFQSIRDRSLVSWNAMITAYASTGHPREAFHTLEAMISYGIAPNEISIACALGFCDDLELGQSIHARIFSQFPGLESGVMVQTSLVSFYARIGRLEMAKAILDRSRIASVAPWNAMIAGYAQHGHIKEALGTYHSMDLEGLVPNHRTLTIVLSACSSSRDIETGKVTHSRALDSGFDREEALQVAAVNLFGRCGRLVEARRVFDSIARKNVAVWTAMIGGYVQHGYRKQALEVFEAMDVPPNEVTYVTILTACSSLEQGRAIHERILGSKMRNSRLVLDTALVKMYANFDEVVCAKSVFDRMGQRDLVAWNTMLGGYVQNGRAREALELYRAMKIEPDATTLSTVLGACSLLGDLATGMLLHKLLADRNLTRADVIVCSSLVNMYAKCGCVSAATEVFQDSRAAFGSSIVLWNTILAAVAQAGDSREALELVLEMEVEGLPVDSTTFVCALAAFSHAGLVSRAKLLFEIMVVDHSIEPSLDHCLCLADLLGRTGGVDSARELVDAMPYKADTVAWKTLLASFRDHVDVDGATLAAQELAAIDGDIGQPYVLLSNIYASCNS